MRRSFLPGVWLFVLCFCSCQHRVAGPAPSGQSSFEVLEPPLRNRTPEISATDTPATEFAEHIPAYYAEKDFVLPEYPPAALAAQVGVRVVTVTVSFDEKGNAAQVTPSWGDLFVVDPFTEDFFAAIKHAAMRWKISAPRRVYYRRDASGEKLYLRTEARPTAMNVRFVFGASGKVDASR